MWIVAGILVHALALARQEGTTDPLPLVVDEITVTAQKREEDLQDVPISLTAISSIEIENARLQGAQDLAALIPNLSIANTFTVGNSFVTVRGIAQVNNSDSPVAVVVDGVYQGPGGPEEADVVGGAFRDALGALAAVPRMVIAAVSGFALGGGCELALACDMRIASERAKFGQPEILLGIIPGGGGTQRLARLVGPARAKDMILRGRQVGAEEALRIGLVDEVVAPDELHPRALAVAGELAKGALAAQALAKRAIDEGLSGTLADGVDREHDLFVESFRTDDAKIGVASFLEHGPGKATFTGR